MLSAVQVERSLQRRFERPVEMKVEMKMKTTDAAVGYAKENGERFVEELKALLRIPSISTDPERAADVRHAAEFVAAELRRTGMENVR